MFLEKLKSINLLYVEDDDTTRKLYVKMFSKYFDNIFISNNGNEALEVFQKNSIDLIITDIEMPILSGIEFIKCIRKINEEIPILVTTNYEEVDYLKQSIKLSVTDYLLKPLSFVDIQETFEKCILKIEKNKNLSIFLNDDFEYFPSKSIIKRNDEVIPLQNKESKLLDLLLKNRGKIVTKEMIDEIIYAGEDFSYGTIKNIILSLRKKIDTDSITTIRNQGYMFI